MSVDELQHARGRQSAEASRCQMVLGRALRKAGHDDEAMPAFERAAALVPLATGPAARTRSWPQIALDKKDRARAIAELTGAGRRRLQQRRRRAPARRPDARSGRRRRRRSSRRCIERIVAIDPFDGDAHATLGRLALAAQRRRRRLARVPRRARARTGRRSRAPTPISPRAISKPASGPRPRSRRSRRSRSRRATSARRICCSSWSETRA